MKRNQGLNAIPELQGLTADQQHQVWQASTRAAHRIPRLWGMDALTVVGVMITAAIPEMLAITLPFGMTGSIWAGLCSGLGVLIASRLRLRTMRPIMALMRQALESHARDTDGLYYVPPAF